MPPYTLKKFLDPLKKIQTPWTFFLNHHPFININFENISKTVKQIPNTLENLQATQKFQSRFWFRIFSRNPPYTGKKFLDKLDIFQTHWNCC